MSYEWMFESENGELIVMGQVEYSIIPGDPGVRTFRNGDPGYPPTPAEVVFWKPTITKVIVGKHEIITIEEGLQQQSEFFFQKIQESLEDTILVEYE
ncbi:MAG: hypothetical protein WC341_17010 [Bacteroidales bacterium]|jgi:hypothetical protein